jgi:competence protein ComEA
MELLKRTIGAGLLAVGLSVSAAPPVNINTADSQNLVDELVGVGPQKAMAIIRYRQENGPFQQVDDLTLVSGIGTKTVELNRDRMTVDTSEPEQQP